MVVANDATTPRVCTDPVLRIEGLVAGYGDVAVLQGVHFAVERFETVCVIGPNGAGKSSVLKAIMGLLQIQAGTIALHVGQAWQDLSRWSTSQVVQAGVAITPQTANVFGQLSVRENLMVVAHLCHDPFAVELERALTMFPDLRDHLHKLAGTLSGGQRQMVAIARALLPRPRLLLLDEPTAGLSPANVQRTLATIDELKQHQQVAVVLVEQNAQAALQVSDYGYVLTSGVTHKHAKASELLHHDELGAILMGAPPNLPIQSTVAP